MKYYSTNRISPVSNLRDAVIKGLASDKGLYMPESIPSLSVDFFENISSMTFQEMSYYVARELFGDEIDHRALKQIVYDTLAFDIPLKKVDGNIYSLELFHGPTLAFKDVGARFMARTLGYFNNISGNDEIINVLVATSGDTGSAVANGFYQVPGVRVFVLYPKGKVSNIQEAQFTTLGHNITALQIDGTFDDCQALVKNAFMDKELNESMKLTSANSINLARFLPQMFYYFYAYAQLKKIIDADRLKNMVVCVPSGNFGNITAGLFAKRMGLPIRRFIAANNRNDIFFKYLQTGEYIPRSSVETIANAMDVGDPSNFARILELCNHSHAEICRDVSGCTYDDDQIRETILKVFHNFNYLLDPHGAVAYRGLSENLKENEVGVFLETAHPAKFKDTIDSVLHENIEIPQQLMNFMSKERNYVQLSADFYEFKKFILSC